MISLTLNTKKCMAELLLRETFDSFLFIEGSVTTFNKFTIDGYIHSDFYEDDAPAESYSSWKSLREFVFSIIKGKRTPLDFHFVFSLSADAVRTLIAENALDFQPESVQGLYLNFRFDGSTLTCVTGTSLKVFTLDKSLDHTFDKWVENFFTEHGIEYNIAL